MSSGVAAASHAAPLRRLVVDANESERCLQCRSNPADESIVDARYELASLGVGLGLIVLFPLSLPAIALTLVLALPLVPVALAAGLLAAPILLVRRRTRR